MKIQAELFTFPEESKAILRNIRNFLAGRAVGITRDEALLEEVLKILFCVKDLSVMNLSKDSYKNAQVIRKRFAEIKDNLKEFYSVDEELLLDPESISYVTEGLVKIIKSNSSDIDLVGDCYEIFIGNAIRGQDGQFFTPHVAVDFLVRAANPKPDWKIIDTACGASGFLSYLYIFFKKNYSISDADNCLARNIFGIEKDKYLTRLGRMHLNIISGGITPNILNGDSLAMKGDEMLDNIEDGSFDLVITNPPFGTKIMSADPITMRKYELGHKWKEDTNGNMINTMNLQANVPPQVLFMERNIKILKKGGILATVIPESLLSNRNYRHVISYLMTQGAIKAVVGMPESLFKTSGKGGTHTKTCLLIFKKSESSKEQDIFLSEAEWCGHDSRANRIPHNDLPEILVNYFEFCSSKHRKHSSLGYSIRHDEVDNYILAPSYYDYEFESLRKSMSERFNLISIREFVDRSIINISTGDEVGKLAYGTGDIPYIRTSDIANLEVKMDAKHRVSDEVYKKLKFKQDIRAGDILMVKDGTYLIGTVAIVTEHDLPMVYQSHLYKIRVLENDLGLTPYNLLGLLSSNFVQRQIKSKQLTQDIIDSLGRRIYDLVIPLPQDKSLLNTISSNIEEIVQYKAKSKFHFNKFQSEITNAFA
jgi:type I restriction enzyme M protein